MVALSACPPFRHPVAGHRYEGRLNSAAQSLHLQCGDGDVPPGHPYWDGSWDEAGGVRDAGARNASELPRTHGVVSSDIL